MCAGGLLGTVELATDRVRRLTEKLTELVQKWDQAPLVQALQALRGWSWSPRQGL